MDDGECSGSKLDSTDVGKWMILGLGGSLMGVFFLHTKSRGSFLVFTRDVVAGRSCRWVGSFWRIPNSLQVHFVGPFHLI
jgi:hypothetical protein